MATIKNGTSVHDIKDFYLKQIAPKYFDDIKNMNELNVGLYGYITEILANTTKDSYFAITSLFKEIFPTEAELPESIYNHALIYQLSNVFATPSTVPFTILISEDKIIENSTNGSDFLYFDMDSNMEFNINSITYMLDYDIRITTKKTINGYVHSSQYIMDKENALSSLLNPFIRTGIYTNENGKRYIMMEVRLHQVNKRTISDTIITNDKINVVTLDYKFDNQLANFDVYYQAPGETNYIQLKKVLANSNKLDDPFCYYKLIDDNTLEISFSTDERYFQPAYNSNIYVELYTTVGEDANFDVYEGEEIEVVGKSDRFTSNRGVIFMGTVTGGSTGGSNRKTLEELRNETVKARSTVKSFTTSSDLNLYFDSVTEQQTSKILFMKKRDDAFERLYSAFILFRDKDNNVIPTNTLDIRYASTDIATSIEQEHRHVIKAGMLHEYVVKDTDCYAKVCDTISYDDNLDEYEKTKFLYINPFLTIVCTNPLNVGFYINTISDSLSLAHTDSNTESFNQFIVNTVSISRDALAGEDNYLIEVRLEPSAMLDKEAFKLVRDDTLVRENDRTFVNPTDGYTYIDNDNLRAMLEIVTNSNETRMYIMLDLVGFDTEAYFFSHKIKTSDYVSTAHNIQMLDGFRNPRTFKEDGDPVMIPATDCQMNLYTFYRYPTTTEAQTHQFAKFDELKYFTLTNSYTLAEDSLANFVIPVQEVRSYVDYTVKEVDTGKYGFRLDAVPLIKANYFKMDGTKTAFMNSFKEIYSYIQSALDMLTNNFQIDMKFFNTYGLSDHYYIIGKDDKEHIDKVNISIYFDVKYTLASNADSLTEQLKEYIKKHIESNELSLVSAPNFYMSKLLAECQEKFSGLKYMLFKGINNYKAEVQALESDVNESNIIQGIVETSTVIPEYLNIDFIIKNGVRTPQIFINVL